MGRVNISFENVKQKTDELKQSLETELASGIITRYEKLDKNIEQSCGKGVESIRAALRQEKSTLSNVNQFMIELLNFIQESADAFEHVDTNHEEVMRKFI